MSERVCLRCEKPLTGRQRKWCGENCRKRVCDDAHRATCQRCGATLCTRSGFAKPRGTYESCVSCRRKRDTARQRARIELVAQLYRDGLTQREIARELGYGSNSTPWEITAARRLGLIGYRYPTERVATMRDARWGAAA